MMPPPEVRRCRIAVVGLFNSEERDKLVLIVHGIRQAGHIPILVDAELFVANRCRLGRAPGGEALIVAGSGTSIAVVDEIQGSHRSLEGTREQVVVDGITVVTANLEQPLISASARVRAGTTRPADQPVPVDALWPEALDITRRLEFEHLYRGLAGQQFPSLAGSWDSVLNTIFKHRMRAVLDRSREHIPQPRVEILVAAMTDTDIERISGRLRTPNVWLKAPNDSHSHGVICLRPGERAGPAARTVMRKTPDGTLCLVEEDICGILEDPAGRHYRADLAVTVLDGRAIHATLRVQPDLGRPTNSLHGGQSLAVVPGSLPAEVRRIAVGAVTATGSRYGSVDILGGLVGAGPYTVHRSPRPVVCEVNKMPGGRSPGFLSQVVGPLVAAYVTASSLTDPVAAAALGEIDLPGDIRGQRWGALEPDAGDRAVGVRVDKHQPDAPSG